MGVRKKGNLQMTAKTKRRAADVAAASAPGDAYEGALAALKAAKLARDEGLERAARSRAELDEVRRQLRQAVDAENFDAATELKAKRDALEQASSREAKGKLEKSVQDAATALATVYFERHSEHKRTSKASVTRVVIVNPETHHSAEVMYLESDETVSLSLDGQSFESEAWHLIGWAVSKGFLLHSNNVSVEV